MVIARVPIESIRIALWYLVWCVVFFVRVLFFFFFRCVCASHFRTKKAGRVHEYPVMSSKAREIATTYARDIAKDRTQSLVVSMFDGTNSMDSICVRCFVNRTTVMRYISSLGSDCVVVPK